MSYIVSLEIAGPCALWTRPDTGDCPVSYPAPTYSAVRGIFESILWGPAIRVVPFFVEICKPLQYHAYQTNYGGPLRKSGLIKSGDNYQLLAEILINVCYKLHAKVFPVGKSSGVLLSGKASEWDKKTTSPGHAYQAIFNRRLKRGQSFSIPFLGWKEFVPDYVGTLRAETTPCKEINLVIPSMLREVFPYDGKSTIPFVYDQDVEIREGLLTYPTRKEG